MSIENRQLDEYEREKTRNPLEAPLWQCERIVHKLTGEREGVEEEWQMWGEGRAVRAATNQCGKSHHFVLHSSPEKVSPAPDLLLCHLCPPACPPSRPPSRLTRFGCLDKRQLTSSRHLQIRPGSRHMAQMTHVEAKCLRSAKKFQASLNAKANDYPFPPLPHPLIGFCSISGKCDAILSDNT